MSEEKVPISVSMRHTDDWIEDRIRFRAAKYGLPTENTRFFYDWPNCIRDNVIQSLPAVDLGGKVLLAYKATNFWSLLTTQVFVSSSDEGIAFIRNSDIQEMSSRDYLPKNHDEMELVELAQMKQSWEYLLVTDKDGKHNSFWVPQGPAAFAFWNILLMLDRLE